MRGGYAPGELSVQGARLISHLFINQHWMNKGTSRCLMIAIANAFFQH